MAEDKRLPPKPSTLRELYVLSGNLCANPGCETVLVNRKGTMVGEVCHIKAAKRGRQEYGTLDPACRDSYPPAPARTPLRYSGKSR